MFILSRNHFTSVVSKILENISKYKRVYIEEGKALIHLSQLIHIEEQIMHLFKSLEDQDEISDKGKNDFHPLCSKPGVLYGLAKILKALEDGILFSRPILSTMQTPPSSNYTLKDSLFG